VADDGPHVPAERVEREPLLVGVGRLCPGLLVRLLDAEDEDDREPRHRVAEHRETAPEKERAPAADQRPECGPTDSVRAGGARRGADEVDRRRRAGALGWKEHGHEFRETERDGRAADTDQQREREQRRKSRREAPPDLREAEDDEAGGDAGARSHAVDDQPRHERQRDVR